MRDRNVPSRSSSTCYPTRTLLKQHKQAEGKCDLNDEAEDRPDRRGAERDDGPEVPLVFHEQTRKAQDDGGDHDKSVDEEREG